MHTIIYAGFGVWNSTLDVTALISRLYSQGAQTFTCNDCKINDTQVEDPSYGNHKYLYIVYSYSGGRPYNSVVIGESDPQGVTLPPHPLQVHQGG